MLFFEALFNLNYSVCACHGTYVEVSGQLMGGSPYLPSCGSRGSDSSCQIWHPAPLPLSHIASPKMFLFSKGYYPLFFRIILGSWKS